MKKKMLAFLMAVLIVVGIFPVTAMADDPVYVAQIGDTKYNTFAEAYAKVKENGDTTKTVITLLQNCTTPGFGADGDSAVNYEVDLNGKTLTLSAPAVGSKGTETQAIRVLQGSTAEFKNGTLKIVETNKTATSGQIKMFINKYGDLTLDNVTVDGTNLYNGGTARYVVSNNSGTTSIKNSTIIAADGDFAFDSYKFGSYTVPTVTVENSTINGKIEVDGGNLIIKSGSFTDLANAVKYAEDGATIKLFDDVTITSQLNIDKAITLDGNGKTITRTPGRETAAKKAGILVTAGATIKNLTVSGPNTTASGWDSGEFGIKFFNASGAKLDGVTVTGANAGVQVNGGSVTMTGTITLTGNEFGGIELCHGGTLNLSDATLVNDGETDANPVLWNDDNKGTITFNEAQALYIRAVDEDKDHYYLDCEAKINETNYRTLAAAIAAAPKNSYSGDATTIVLTKDTNGGYDIDEGRNIVLDLNGKTLTLGPAIGSTGTETNGMRVLKGNKLTIKNGTIKCSDIVNDKGKKVKIGLANYDTAVLENVDFQSGTYVIGTINNAGNLTLKGNTTIGEYKNTDPTDNPDYPRGAILNSAYWYAPAGTNCSLNVNDSKVKVGTVEIAEDGNYGDNDSSNWTGKSIINISAGMFNAIVAEGTQGLAEYNVTGGTFASKPDDKFLAENYFAKKLSDTEWKVEPKAKVVEGTDGKEIKIGEKTVAVEGATSNDDKTKTVTAINDVLDNTAVTTFEAANLGKAITEEIAGGKILDTEVKVEPKSVKVTVSGNEATIIEMVFDVQPKVTITDTTTGATETKEIHKTAEPIKFRLPIDKNITDKTVAVYHEETEGGEFKLVGTFEIKTDENGEKYIEIEASNFSLYSYKVLNEANAVAKTDDGKYYATLANAIEKASGKTVTIIKDTDEVVIVERAMNFKLEVATGVNFTGAIRPGDDYVRHIYGDNYYFELYEAGDTIVIGGKKTKDTKTETKEENPETGAPVMSMGALVVLAAAYVATRKH